MPSGTGRGVPVLSAPAEEQMARAAQMGQAPIESGPTSLQLAAAEAMVEGGRVRLIQLLPSQGGLWVNAREYPFDLDHPDQIAFVADKLEDARVKGFHISGRANPSAPLLPIEVGAPFPAEIQVLEQIAGG